MRLYKDSSTWTSAILHVVIFVGLFLTTIIEAFLPKEKVHVFEMVSKPVAEQTASETNSSEPVPELSLPEVTPLKIPEPTVSKTQPKPRPEPVTATAKPKETSMSYEEFLKMNLIKDPKPRASTRPSTAVSVPTINTQQFGVNLKSELFTADTDQARNMTAAERTELQRYGDRLNGRLNRAWIKPANIAGINLVVKVIFDVSSNGNISNIRLSPGSGNAAFDASVKSAFAQVGSVGATPTGQRHTFTMSFKMVN